MESKKAWYIGVGFAIMGSISWTALSASKTDTYAEHRSKRTSTINVTRNTSNKFSRAAPQTVTVPAAETAVVQPPSPPIFAHALDKEIKTTPAKLPLSPVKSNTQMQSNKTPKSKVAAKSIEQAKSSATKPAKFFSYTRLLNFSPHPTEEEFLREKPLVLNGHKYWLKVSYRESWDVDENDNGKLQNIAFNIQLMEGASVVRDLKLPAVKIDAKKLKAGQIIGLAEVAPYKFRIAVDDFRISNGGVSDLTFKFDMTS